MALITKDYKQEKKELYSNELKQYSSSNYGYAVREKAFEFIGYLSLWDLETIKNLVNASQHHYWRFRASSREILNKLLKIDTYKKQIILLSNTMDDKSQFFLSKLMEKN